MFSTGYCSKSSPIQKMISVSSRADSYWSLELSRIFSDGYYGINHDPDFVKQLRIRVASGKLDLLSYFEPGFHSHAALQIISH